MNQGNQKKNKQMKFYVLFNLNNPSVQNAIKNCVKVLRRNNISGFESIRLINSNLQPSNFKKLLTKAELSNEEVGVKKYPDL